MGAPAEQIHATNEPLVIQSSHGFDSYTFALDWESRERLQDEAQDDSAPLPPARLTVETDLRRPFAESFAAMAAHVLPLLTNLPVDRLRQVGGVEVRDAETHRTLWRLTG
jgi:hypothetical protein